MHFDPAEHDTLLRDSLRRFFAERVAPHAREWDEAERFPSELIPELAALGLLGIRIPRAYGGAELDTSAYAIAVEEAARVDGSLALTIASHNGLGTGHILAFGSEALKQRYLPRACSGEWLAAWALSEAGSGSDSAGLCTRAVREGDHWVIDGSKMFITQGSVAGFCVVLARTDFEAEPQRGITAFVVDTDAPGYSVSKRIKKLGCRASDTVEIALERVCVPDSRRLGEVNQGFRDAMRILDAGRVSVAAMALGLGRGALEMAIRYARQREAFGKPIAEFQAIQWMLADARTELDAAELLVRRAAWLADRGRRFTTEASMAKLFASEVATRVCNNALQIHGGYGYTRELDIERHLRDVKLCEIGEGTSQVQRLIIARQLLSGCPDASAPPPRGQ
jgi:alkylation response protein AidB-like acyl-CoA dehydrogenase